ncbi:hypothetical protein PINS_up004380 [Pythium insidiosum]|nr:hypothetical protein PINS_up004380 [Pythium insidiosum]
MGSIVWWLTGFFVDCSAFRTATLALADVWDPDTPNCLVTKAIVMQLGDGSNKPLQRLGCSLTIVRDGAVNDNTPNGSRMSKAL